MSPLKGLSSQKIEAVIVRVDSSKFKFSKNFLSGGLEPSDNVQLAGATKKLFLGTQDKVIINTILCSPEE